MRIETNFENDFFNLKLKILKLKEENPQNEIIKRFYFDLGNLSDSYERQKEAEKEENKKSVKQLLRNIIKCLHDED